MHPPPPRGDREPYFPSLHGSLTWQWSVISFYGTNQHMLLQPRRAASADNNIPCCASCLMRMKSRLAATDGTLGVSRSPLGTRNGPRMTFAGEKKHGCAHFPGGCDPPIPSFQLAGPPGALQTLAAGRDAVASGMRARASKLPGWSRVCGDWSEIAWLQGSLARFPGSSRTFHWAPGRRGTPGLQSLLVWGHWTPLFGAQTWHGARTACLGE